MKENIQEVENEVVDTVMEVQEKEDKSKNRRIQPKELSYDDLKNIAGQLQQRCELFAQECGKLREENQMLKTNQLFARIEFLFKVVGNTNMAFDEEYVAQCAAEIKDLLTIPEPEQEVLEPEVEE